MQQFVMKAATFTGKDKDFVLAPGATWYEMQAMHEHVA